MNVREQLDHLAGTTVYVNGGEYSADAIEPRAFAALRAVLDVHAPIGPTETSTGVFCTGCWNEPVYPCATVRAIQTALEQAG